MRRLEKLLKRKRALVYESLKLSTGADEVAYSNRFLNIFHKNVHETELSELTKELGGCFGAHEGENRASKVVKYMPSSSLVEYIRSLVEKREFSSLALRQPMKGFLDDSALIALAVAVEEMAAEIVSSIWASSSGLMEVGDEDLMSAVLEAASFQYQAATVYSPSFPSSNQEAQTAHALHVVALGMNRIEVMLGLPSNIQELWSLMLQRFEKERASQAETTEYDIVEKAFHARNDRSFKDRTHPGVRTDFDGSPAYVSNAFFAVESSSLPSSALT